VKDVRILIADDHEVVRKGIRAVLESEPGWTVCGEAATGREAVAKAIELRPDVVLLDVSMPQLNGLEATKQIHKAVPASILIMTMHESDRIVREAMDAGASGYVSKVDAGGTLVDAVRTLLARRTYVSDRLHVADDMRAAAEDAAGSRPRTHPLTAREREVLQLLAEGKSNKEIGAVLGISTKTAETHRARIMAKLRLHSMSELVRYAIRNQVIEP
jgi:DNA-binding NarL/FixJ family response regulator